MAPAESNAHAAPNRRAAAREIALAYVSVSALTWLVTRARGVPPFDAYVHLIVAALFLASALKLAARRPGGVRGHGLALSGLLEPEEVPEGPAGPLGLFDLARALWRAAPCGLRELGFALLVAVVVFPPFVVGFYLWHGPDRPFTFALPDQPASFALAQFVVVALPEEAFFRGYLQTALRDVFPRRRRLLGVELSLGALLTTALLFALIHFLIDLQPARLAVFFPGLLFGWVREKRGGVGASLALHALSNLLSEVLVRGWL